MKGGFFVIKKKESKYKSDYWETYGIVIIITVLVYSFMTGVILYLDRYL